MLNATQIVSLLNIKGIGPKTVYNLWSVSLKFEDIKDLYCYIQDVTKDQHNRYPVPPYERFLHEYFDAEAIIEKSKDKEIQIIALGEKSYPARLSKIANPPLVLYVKGNIDCLSEKLSVAIIGTRKPTEYGQKVAWRLGEYFAENSFVVVSGLAEGCDTGAHTGCLSKDGNTVAVLAHGLDKVYPAKNKKLADEIIDKNGCLISEYAVGVPGRPSNFVARDRIQSGLSLGVLVVETGVKSGTMHTVAFCREQKRVLACHKHPEKYNVCESVMGNIKLIAEGATPIETKPDLDRYKDSLILNSKQDRETAFGTNKCPQEKEDSFPLFKGQSS
jgi:DNA processing protein